MGMTIDEIIQELEDSKDYPASDPASDEALDGAIEIMRKYQQLQADYENRLKADMVAMLTELQLEIEEQRKDNPEFDIWKDGYNTANDIDCVIIQQKINALKGVGED